MLISAMSGQHSEDSEDNARSRDLNTRPLLATYLNPFYKCEYNAFQMYSIIVVCQTQNLT